MNLLPLQIIIFIIKFYSNNKTVTFQDVWTIISSWIKIIGEEHDFL